MTSANNIIPDGVIEEHRRGYCGVEIRPCGIGWEYCDVDCDNCYKNHKTYTKDTEVDEANGD